MKHTASNFWDINGTSLDGLTILVTGGTGSFGRQFCATVLKRFKLAKLIVFSRDETKQVEMRGNQTFAEHDATMRYFIGDVRDLPRLEMAFRGVDVVIHAAALKHVSVAEYNPFECIRTNVHGAENVVVAAIGAEVKRVIALSTDKAVSPINLYGASKLAADKIFAAAKHLVGPGNPRFAVVRYGNVVGSRGSVVPHFQRLIRENARKLPVTDERMTRFWITLQQGVDFVLSCLSLVQLGEVFVPKIPSMRIIDLAKTLAPNLEIDVVGIRPGEKLHEILITADEARTTIELPDRYVVRSALYQDRFHYHPEEKSVPERFQYASDENPEWLKPDSLRAMLGELTTPDDS